MPTEDFVVTHNTFALLMGAARYVHVPGYYAIILRRTTPEIRQAGGLVDASREIYGGWAKFSETKLRFLSEGQRYLMSMLKR